MNKKVEEPQDHASEHRSTREIPKDELRKILEAHKKWILSDRKIGERANLSRVILRGADLSRADLSRADLSEADLRGANLFGVILFGADLSEADLSGANLSGAILFGAILRGADLSRANLRGANLSEADLRGANLENGVQYLTASRVKKAKNWELAFYSDDFIKKLGLKPDHNERVRKKLAEMEKKKKATGGKP